MAHHEVSETRLYLGNLPKNVTKPDIEKYFNKDKVGKIIDIKIMNGFGFIEYDDAMDARDIVPAFHGTDFMGQRLTVQFARGNRPREYRESERANPRPRRTGYRMQISGLPNETSWQDLKDFARLSSLEVVYSEAPRDKSGKGYVEFETLEDLRSACERLDGREFRGNPVHCAADPSSDVGRDSRGRSRSPGARRRHGPPDDDYERRGPPARRYNSPGRDGFRDEYRDRSRDREYFDDRRGGYRSPRGRPGDDYGPTRRNYGDPHRRDYGGAPPGGFSNGGRQFDRAPRDFPPQDQGFRDGDYPGRDFDSRGPPSNGLPPGPPGPGSAPGRHW